MEFLALTANSEITVHLAKEPSGFPWFEVIKLVGALGAFAIGLWQYVRAQRWKRVEFVAAEMKNFGQNLATKGARIMLDWSVKYIPLYRLRGDEDETIVRVSYDKVRDALAVPPPGFDKPESAIREIFDEFLEFLERFEGYVHAEVVTQEDFAPYLHYWTKLLSGNDEHAPRATKTVLPAFWKFAGYYGYDDVLTFVDRYSLIKNNLRAAFEAGKSALSDEEAEDS